MELFKFAPSDVSTNKLVLENGRMINGITKTMWIERYREAGEFTITAPMSSNLRTELPIGSIISHTGTTEFMIVENHSIVDDNEKPAEITISGRSYETFMENRIVSANGYALVDPNQAVPTYTMASGRPAAQAAELIEQHVYVCAPQESEDSIWNLRTVADVNPFLGVAALREIEVNNLYAEVLKLLELDNLGIMSVRPGPWLNYYRSLASPGQPFYNLDDVGFIIHQGADRSSVVSFSYDLGEITNAEYLWSNKNLSNSAFVQGKYFRVRVAGSGAEESFERRVIYVDAHDIDDTKDTPTTPVGATRTAMIAAMVERGKQALAKNSGVEIARVEVTQNNPRFRYNIDYNVGDIVGVNGNYDIVGKMRVVEQVTIMDEYGYSSYPTLATL